MSLIRKPDAAERASPLRRAAEAGLTAGRDLHRSGRTASQAAGRGLGRVGALWLLVMFTFGALTAGSWGATLLGLAIMAPCWVFALRKWNKPPKPGESARSSGISKEDVHSTVHDLVDLYAPWWFIMPSRRKWVVPPVDDEPAAQFDADAAFARYLAGKDSADPAAPPGSPHPRGGAGRTFGRRSAQLLSDREQQITGHH
ncbi:hypothetical protein OMW55_09645 [Sphingomonas sp. BN140010]|uniref:Uncharacterized protein n=1 Tax=Sphingomonas arvum TaxID=2992113 RepID=A0ABT3JG75_9SPHN|nr:hypothetical protein [Sphingomonas sp. BN140010]MCW3798065.1 hypothetical protein [Sphingomonas sp. BN140010]